MKKITISFILIICFLLVIAFPLPAQDKIPEGEVTSTSLGPIDTSNTELAGLLETFTASQNTSERTITITWDVYQQCLFGSHLSVKLYRNNVLIYSNTYPATTFGLGWRTTFYDHVGPGKSYTYKLDRFSSDGFLCNSHWTPTYTGSTKPVQPPKNLIVSNPTNSDKYIQMSWENGSEITSYYIIYEGNTQIATTYSTNYTVSTTPGKEASYGVATYSYYGIASAKVSATGKTATFYKPENFFVSKDTTVGYIRLGWTCASDYATQFQIYRDNDLHTTIPVAQTSFLDYSVVPGNLYTYKVRAYNTSGLASAFSPELTGRSVFLKASDGLYDDEVYVHWTKFPLVGEPPEPFEDELILYRDGEIVDGVYSGQVEKYDKLVNPGKIHHYLLEVKKNNQLLLTVSDYGFAPADGSVKGSVKTPSGIGGVKNVEMRAYATEEQLSSALLLDGIDDYISAPPLNLNSNSVTMSAWIKPNGIQNDWTGILYSRASNTVAGIHLMANGELRYNWNNQSAAYTWSSGLIVPDNEWSFIALVIEPDQATLYLNDTSAVNVIPHALEEFDGEFEIGRDLAGPDRYYNGALDEICVWNIARTAEQIMADQHHILRGTESGLVAYWRFNLGSGSAAGDYTEDGNHHGTIMGGPLWANDSPGVWHYGITKSDGSYSILRINWAEDLDFTIRPFKEGHGFKGETFPEDSLVLTFSGAEHEFLNKNFIDTTSIEVSGWVYADSDPPCPLPGAKILVDNEFSGEYTDSTGHFSISVANAGKYTISAEYLNHEFDPADTLLDIQDPVTDLIFQDTSRVTISGKMAGGCDNFLGIAKIRIKNVLSDCLDTLLTTDENGHYSIILPAQLYSMQLEEIDHPDQLTIINYFTADTLDVSEHDTTYNIIYHSPPITRISELPPAGCGEITVPILQQEITYAMRVDVVEIYGELECPVSQGTVVIHDYVAYSNPDSTIVLENGGAYYPLKPGYPNLAGGGPHPYQKMMVIRTNVDRYAVYDTLWFFIRGQKPREFEFSTVSPEIPLMILRDPPGDQSFSYLSKSTSSSVNIGFSYENEVGIGIFSKFKVGGGADIPGLGSTGAWVGGEAEANIGLRNTIEGTQEIVISATEMLKTSGSDVIIGERGDVYMGAAINILYAKTDILDFDADQCTVVRDTGIVWNGDGFKTTYLYTESHIRESVIPGLQTLADILNSSGEKIKQDSAEVLLNQIAVWQQVLDHNAGLKQNAVPLPAFPDNVTFSAGPTLSEEATVKSTTTLSIGLNLFIDASVAVSIGAKAGDFNEAEGGVKIFSKLDIGVSAGATYEVTNTIGFELGDDDDDPPGDVITVDIMGDPAYGTPVFNLKGGKTSCPWEPGTLPREGVGLTMNTFQLNNVPPEQPANFDLFLYNLSQSDETRTYLLSLVQGSNPDAAIISVGGAVLGDDELEFSLEPDLNTPQRATLRVKREMGSVFDYENLQVHLYSPCDAQMDTAVSFSVHFLKPCSDVKIIQPANNWILNSTHNKQMVIVLKDYDPGNQSFEQLKFEYRAYGTEPWTELFSYARALLPADSIRYVWDMSSMPEGIYELRASTHCALGIYYTRIHAGMFDYQPPVAFGQPQPSDGFLDAGDAIMIEFSEDIDCVTANKNNITLNNLSKNMAVDIDIACKGDQLVITAVNEEDLVEGDTLQVTISSISDPFGNVITEPISWEFVVNIISLLPDETEPEIPTHFALYQNYPNPFNPETTIRFAIPQAVDVSLVIYDITGKEIIRPVSERLSPGYYHITFDGRNYSSGIYFYRLTAGSFVQTKKLILVK